VRKYGERTDLLEIPNCFPKQKISPACPRSAEVIEQRKINLALVVDYLERAI
jgi:hypothetical protein